MSGASERANGRASGPVLQSVFLAVLDHSGRPSLRREAGEGKGATVELQYIGSTLRVVVETDRRWMALVVGSARGTEGEYYPVS